MSSKKKRRIIVYGLVTRYGPCNQLSAHGVKRYKQQGFREIFKENVTVSIGLKDGLRLQKYV